MLKLQMSDNAFFRPAFALWTGGLRDGSGDARDATVYTQTFRRLTPYGIHSLLEFIEIH